MIAAMDSWSYDVALNHQRLLDATSAPLDPDDGVGRVYKTSSHQLD